MFIQKKKRVICIGMMLMFTAFVGMATNVSANQPPVAEANGPYSSYECQEIILDTSGSYDPDGDSLTNQWHIGEYWVNNYNNPTLTWAWFDDFNEPVLLEVSDGEATAIDSAMVTVLNVDPVITSVNGPTEITLEEELILYVSFYDGFIDPIRGLIASSDTYTAYFDWGDGSSDSYLLGVQEFTVSGSHVYADSGEYTITIIITDDDGGEAIFYWYITVYGDIQLVNAGSDAELNEGSEFMSAGSLADDSGTYSAQVDYGDGTGVQELLLNPGNTFNLQHIYGDNGIFSVVVTAFLEGEEWGSDEVIVTVYNVAPTIESLAGSSADPVQLGSAYHITSVFSDPGYLDTHVATIDWGDGQTTSISIPYGSYNILESHIYTTAGVYKITLTVIDDDGGSDTEILENYVVVYDPSAGFVTGGGWIIAPPGSYPADPTLTGKATFGFVSKYKKGQSYPTGNTEFQFHVASMNFHSHTYEWLVIAGPLAMYKGTGTINGEGNYGFLVTARDGQINGGGGIDTFRIKIWDENNGDLIVFDNNDDIALGGGQITIHKA
jgi:PKD repeat protein